MDSTQQVSQPLTDSSPSLNEGLTTNNNAHPPNSENYTFTPRLPQPPAPPSGEETGEDSSANNSNDSVKVSLNGMSLDTTGLSDRAKQRLGEARQAVMEHAMRRRQKCKSLEEAVMVYLTTKLDFSLLNV